MSEGFINNISPMQKVLTLKILLEKKGLSVGGIPKSLTPFTLLNFKTTTDLSIDSAGDYFIKTFDAKRKLKFANMALQAYWAGENNYTCRSKMFSCFIYSEDNISIFKETIPFCKESELHGYKINRIGSLLETDILCCEE